MLMLNENEMSLKIRQLHFNTSYVNVKPDLVTGDAYRISYFNTSYVNVKLFLAERNCLSQVISIHLMLMLNPMLVLENENGLAYFNTSYVNVKPR